jgi:lysophospholipase L1-like esterase
LLDRTTTTHKALGAFVVALAVVLSTLYARLVWPFESRLELSHERFYAVKAEVSRKPNSVIVFGDSLVEGATLPKSICGYAVVNAGVVGATVRYFEHHASELLDSSHPRLIVLAVGINDASPATGPQFSSRYQKTVALLSRTAPVAVATITPVRRGNGSTLYDGELVPKFNDVIRATPNVKAVIDLNKPLSAANWTTDGIHLGAEGYALWTKAMVEGVSEALGCHPP